MQSPSTVVTPNTSVIDNGNMSAILQKVDICFSSNKGCVSEETLNKYNVIKDEKKWVTLIINAWRSEILMEEAFAIEVMR